MILGEPQISTMREKPQSHLPSVKAESGRRATPLSVVRLLATFLIHIQETPPFQGFDQLGLSLGFEARSKLRHNGPIETLEISSVA